jgi:hypothetical protein
MDAFGSRCHAVMQFCNFQHGLTPLGGDHRAGDGARFLCPVTPVLRIVEEWHEATLHPLRWPVHLAKPRVGQAAALQGYSGCISPDQLPGSWSLTGCWARLAEKQQKRAHDQHRDHHDLKLIDDSD